MHSMFATLLSFLLLAKPSRSMRTLLMREGSKTSDPPAGQAEAADRTSLLAAYLEQPASGQEEVEMTEKREEIHRKVVEMYSRVYTMSGQKWERYVAAKTDQFIQGFDSQVDELLWSTTNSTRIISAELVKLLTEYHKKFEIEKMEMHFTGADGVKEPFLGYDGHYQSLFLYQKEAVRLFADDYWLKQESLKVTPRIGTGYNPTRAIPLNMMIATKLALEHLALVLSHPVFKALPDVLAGQQSFATREKPYLECVVKKEISMTQDHAVIVTDYDERIAHLQRLLRDLMSFVVSLQVNGVTTLPGL